MMDKSRSLSIFNNATISFVIQTLGLNLKDYYINICVYIFGRTNCGENLPKKLATIELQDWQFLIT